MMVFVRQGRRFLRQLSVHPMAHTVIEGCGYFLAGFCFSAASLGNSFLPLAMGLIYACTGMGAILATFGGVLGYLVFWETLQPAAWCAVALLLSALLGNRKICRETPLLLPMAAALTVALWGVVFQVLGRDDSPIAIYVLRIVLGGVTCGLFTRVLRERNPLLDWFACGFGVLALAQIVPVSYLGLGYIAAGALVARGTFPAAALAGLALDLAGITPLPMTAVVCLSYLVRFLPRQPQWLGGCTVVCVSGMVMYVCGIWDIYPVPGLFLGAMLGVYLPFPGPVTHRRGEIGLAQVRLELASGVMSETQHLLAEVPQLPVDEGSLIQRAAEEACGGCPYRKNCKDVRRIAQLPGALLHKPLVSGEELPILCKKSGRFLASLHRAQEQLRSILADRERQREYRAAVLQQYGFLAGYLQELSDMLVRKPDRIKSNFQVQSHVFGNHADPGNGDRCQRFLGTEGRYYIILCDGMGTGIEANLEAKTGGDILRRLLLAGYPAEHALGSLNSICALRDRAGVLTIDMAEIHLDSGAVTIYKWGAAPSYLIWDGKTEKIGAPTLPPGLSSSGWQTPVKRLSLRCGERLIMVSDGVGEESAFRICREKTDAPDEILARCLIDCGIRQGDDDATVVCVRLKAAQ